MILSELRKRTEKLIHLHRLSGEENTRLKSENQSLVNRLNELEAAKSSEKMDRSSDEIKLKIDEMLREIDKCLEKLNN